jgi:Electron transfer DM13
MNSSIFKLGKTKKNIPMKNLMVISTCIILLFSACKKEVTPTEAIDDMLMSSAIKTYSGNFINGPYGSVSGKAHIIRNANGSLQLQLEGLSSSNGPDLKVYLSKEVQPINFINLGSLRSTNGNQLYDISGTPDFNSYKFVLIHCQAFNHLFGSAPLKMN